jgi:hypothetical protein
MKRILYTFIFLLLTIIPVLSQNLDLIGKEKPFRMNGGISVNQVGYYSTDSISRRDPYNYYLSGNLNLSVYGWSIPLTFSYSNQKVTYTQPFNQYSMHPTYKWVKLHIGYTSMSFSPYTLNGHLFLGGGVELSPKGPFTISAMYGRLQRAVEFDSTAAQPVPPEFERWGYGTKVAYSLPTGESVKAKLGLTLFHASDKQGSLRYLPDSLAYPGENFVLSTNLDMTIKGGFNLTGEIASSAVTVNTGSEFAGDESVGWNQFMGNMLGSNATTEYYTAAKTNFTYAAKIYSIGIGYERIDPGYQTYGSYYFNSDMENVTVNGTLRLLKDKVNLGANVGKQRDNLNDAKASEMKRWVTAFNAGYNSGSKLSATLAYSTFTSFMNIRSEFDYINQVTPYDNPDTLDFTQLSASTSANVTYALQNTERVRQNLSVNFSHQKASETQGDTEVGGGSRFINTNAAYSYSLVPVSLTVSAAMNANVNKMQDLTTSTLGPTVAANKMLFNKKLRISLACSYNRAYSNGLAQNRVLSLRSNSSYRLGKRHNFSLGLTYMNRKTGMQDNPRTLSELIGTLGYSMSF